ncbi:AAA family ATPase [Nonomuraea sp. NPDC059023]|uniref:AAA family ATPase n=1 Tax=Nonomuraea sp. NPDC059023 TaxID=3346706 RepID=UPI00369B2170
MFELAPVAVTAKAEGVTHPNEAPDSKNRRAMRGASMRVWPLVGREAELQEITSAFADGRAAGVVIAGEAGVGRTRLVREALSVLSSDGHRTVWAAATNATSSIPFGAAAVLLPPDWHSHGDRLAALTMITSQVREWAGQARVVIGIDDAHLLDDGSAAALLHLAHQRLAFLVISVRRRERVRDAVSALWEEGLVHRIELAPLPDDVVDVLLDRVLAGPLEGFSRRRIRRVASGNPMLLRELLREASGRGTLAREHGVWRFAGRFRPDGRIRDIVLGRLATADPDTRLVLDLLACGEPLSLTTVVRLAGQHAIETAESSGMAVIEHSGARVLLRLAHPLYGEVLQDAMPVSRSMRLGRWLAEIKLTLPMRRHDDALRVALLQARAQEVIRPEIVRLGAQQAMDRGDLETAERLARMVCTAQPGAEADGLLADILVFRGNFQGAQHLSASRGSDPVRWAITRAMCAYWGEGDAVQADEILDSAATEPNGDLAVGTRAWLLLFDARCASALALACGVLASDTASQQAAVWAAGAGAAAAGFLGLADEAERLGQRGVALADAAQPDLPWAPVQVDLGRWLSLLALGEAARACRLADHNYQTALDAHKPVVAAFWAGCRGVALLTQGHPGEAGESLREAITALDGNDIFRLTRCFHTALAAATALGGDSARARAWLDRAGNLPGPAHRLFAPWFHLWEAWTTASAGDTTAAAAICRKAAHIAKETDLPAVEAAARYDTTRLGGRGEHSRLVQLADQLATPLTIALASAATGIHTGHGDPLTEAAEAFAALGHDLLAAEALTAADRAYRHNGQRARAPVISERAVRLRARCPDATTPLLTHEPLATVLTRREREVAVLAAQHSSRHIAQRLGLSVTTVNNYLAKAYAKLGISRRAQLADLLDREQPH